MAKQRANIIGDALLGDMRETIQRVLSEGASNVVTPYRDGGSGNPWLKIVSATGSPGPQTYLVKVHAHPCTSTPLSPDDQTAYNVAEIGNTAAGGCGYTFDAASEAAAECGDIFGLDAIKVGRFVKLLARVYLTDKWVHLFDLPLIPLIKRGES